MALGDIKNGLGTGYRSQGQDYIAALSSLTTEEKPRSLSYVSRAAQTEDCPGPCSSRWVG
jgi:hypothetical protein